MNSNSRRFLIDEQLKGAPYLEKFGVETIPTGYVIFSPGGKVGEVGEALLLNENDSELAYSYALTAKMFGFKILYLESGSGSPKQVSSDCINAAKKVNDLCLIVGGGIRTKEHAEKAAKSGANWIVTGTLTEDAEDIEDLKMKISNVVAGAQN